MKSHHQSAAAAPAEPSLPRTVAIVGLGMLGGSLGLALKRLPTPPQVLGWARREHSISAALTAGIIDVGSTQAEEILPKAGLTVLCIPVETSLDFGLKHAACWGRGSIVTDVGSTKRELVTRLTPALAQYGVPFVGSHPMAGSENSGLAHADAYLYRQANVFVTPLPETDVAACRLVVQWWEALEAHPRILSPARHDAMVARTSHALHVLAAAAVETFLTDEDDVFGTAGGFRDFTRIASSSPEMWAEILQANSGEVVTALEQFEKELGRLRGKIAAGDFPAVLDHLRRAKNRRDAWLARWRQLREMSR